MSIRLIAAFATVALVAGHGLAGAGGDRAARSERTLVVKFEDAAVVRVRAGTLVSFGGSDLRAVRDVLGAHGAREIVPLLGRDETDVERTRRHAERRVGRRLPDLLGYVEISFERPVSDSVLRDLSAQEPVEVVYRAPCPAPPPVDIPPTTPDGEADQGYLDPAPGGIDARDAWTRPGGRGEGIEIVDIEYNWRDTHEDLETALGRFECFTPDSPEVEHGTAVLGELIGGDNGYGVTGIASGASIGMVTHFPAGMSYSVARAIDCATGFLSPGDVLLVEAQTVGPNGLFVPPEWDAAEYDAIVVAAAAGIIVVETSGNGNGIDTGEDLDDPSFGGAFDRSVRDSGAILVGAGAPPGYYNGQPDRSRLDFSTFGSRVDLQGWGDDVVTTGYGDAFDGDGDPNQFYTAVFDGTSAAAPMVAGAAAIVQGVQIACGGEPLDPIEVRDLLSGTGSAQVAGPYPGNIGPRPDLRSALARIDVDDDADGWAECEGDCDDGVAATHPGAGEVNDGLDNQCPGEPGYGTSDEIASDAGFRDPLDATRLEWTAQPGASTYEVSRSDGPDFSSGCARWETAATSIQDAAVPSPGLVFHYLVRASTPFAGSWGAADGAAERTGACL